MASKSARCGRDSDNHREVVYRVAVKIVELVNTLMLKLIACH